MESPLCHIIIPHIIGLNISELLNLYYELHTVFLNKHILLVHTNLHTRFFMYFTMTQM
jgi:hypothetical protein